MNLSAYITKYGSKINKLESDFITNVFYRDYGERGLDMIEPQVAIYNESTGENYLIDFVLTTEKEKYAIETDGLYYHTSGKVTKEYFDRLQRKQNEMTLCGYKIIRFTSKVLNDSDEIRFELRRLLIDDAEMFQLRVSQSSSIEPHDIQRETLDALNKTRKSGNDKGVVVYATGVGKTYLSAFDVKQFDAKKILFIVHINDIIRQSKGSFEDVLIERIEQMGFFYGNTRELDKDIIFASIQSLSRKKNLELFAPDNFDYIIIDETHHVAAPTYESIFQYFKPKFFLGLTATPERMDKKDILQHFDNNLVYEIDQKTAIHKGLLVPFKYFGFKDDVDYSDIRWSGYRYNVADLNKALMIERRDNAILKKYKEYCEDKKTIGFCVSIDHANHMARLFEQNGYKAIAIHSKAVIDKEDKKEEDDTQTLAFKRGDYEIAFVVDMFNEGIDIKDVNCLLFLRPTESKTIFIQQMGRGLRISPNKEDVIILDFIGNYKTAINILGGLGVDNLGQLEKANTGSHTEKMLYQYDNNGSQVYFQDEVVDVLKELKALESSEVDNDLIDDNWQEYAEYITKASSDNLYVKIGQQNKDIALQLSGISLLQEDQDMTDDSFKELMSERYSEQGMTAGLRSLIFSKVLGLVENKKPLTALDSFNEIENILGEDKNYSDYKKYAHVITRQLEKVAYWNPIFGTYSRYRQPDHQVQFNIVNNFPIIFTNLVIYELKNRYGYESNRISKNEFQFFIVFAKELDQYEEIAEIISRYRQYREKPELRKNLEIASSNADSRFLSVMKYIQYYSLSEDGIKLGENSVESIFCDCEYIIDLMVDNNVISPNKNQELYSEMLRSTDSFIEFHRKHQA